MSVGTGSHAPVGEDGKGFYSAATLGCFNVIKNCEPLLVGALAEVLSEGVIAADLPLQMGDFGTADGGTSMGLMYELCKQVRAVEASRQIQIFYEDQLQNEWKSVFRHCEGEIEVRDAMGALLLSPFKELERVFFAAVGRSFFRQCVPSGSLALGMSFTAMHWLSTDPKSLAGIAGKCHYSQLTEEEKRSGAGAAHVAQAAKDWECIMSQRVEELAPGGFFVCANFAHTPEGYFLGKSDQGASMYDEFCLAWSQLHQAGRITEQECKALSFPNYYRTLEECKQPFLPGGALAGKAEVVSAEIKCTRCPFNQMLQSAQYKGTPEEYAAWFHPTTKTWSNTTFLQALDPARPDKEAVVAEFWQKYQANIAMNPHMHHMDYFHTFLVVRKLR